MNKQERNIRAVARQINKSWGVSYRQCLNMARRGELGINHKAVRAFHTAKAASE